MYLHLTNQTKKNLYTINLHFISFRKTFQMDTDNSKTYLQHALEPFLESSSSVTTHHSEDVMVDVISYVVTTYTSETPIALTTNISIVPQTVILNNTTPSQGVFESKLIIPLYVIIFVLAVLGNSLVLITLMRNKRMRTVTNVYLLNLVSKEITKKDVYWKSI